MNQPLLVLILVFVSLSPVLGGADGETVEVLPATDGKEVILNPDSGYEFKFDLPGFVPALNGIVGVKGIQTGVDVGIDDILKGLNMAAVGRLEVRRSRSPWSLILDGYYADLGVGGSPPGPLISTVDLGVKLVLAEGLVTYRVFENERAWIDLLAGARYVYLGMDLGLRVDSAGIRDVSNEISRRAIDRAVETAQREISQELPALRADLRSRVTSIVQTGMDTAPGSLSGVVDDASMNVRDRVIDQVDQLRKTISDRIDQGIGVARPSVGRRPNFTGPGIGEKIAGRLEDALMDYAKAEADAQIAAAREQEAKAEAALNKASRQLSAAKRKARQKASAQVASTQSRIRREAEKKLAKAEKELSQAIEKGIRDGVPESPVSGSESWVDPFIGLRGRFDISERWYTSFRGDIGGFGINSNLTWNLIGAVGYELNERSALELGYRHFAIEYQEGGFTFDASLSGPFVGFGIEF